MKIVLAFPLTAPSLNQWYSGGHWNERKKVVALWLDEIGWVCKAEVRPITKFPIKISTLTLFKNKIRRDSDNYCTSNKLFSDILVKVGIIPDDSCKYISRQTSEVRIGQDKDETIVTIEIPEETDGL